jgi:hypothetical protein
MYILIWILWHQQHRPALQKTPLLSPKFDDHSFWVCEICQKIFGKGRTDDLAKRVACWPAEHGMCEAGRE